MTRAPLPRIINGSTMRIASPKKHLGGRLWVVLWAAALPGCLGGFTGDMGTSDQGAPASGGALPCATRLIGHSEPTSLGQSAAQLLAPWNSGRTGTQANMGSGFVEALGFEEGTSLPTIQLTLAYQGDSIVDDECGRRVYLGVHVTIEFAETLSAREGSAVLTFDSDGPSLDSYLESAAADDSATLRLELRRLGEHDEASLVVLDGELERRATYRFD